MFNKRYRSVSLLNDCCLSLLRRNKLDQALRLIHDFVERMITEPLCTSQVFGSKDLDDLCRRIGGANLSAMAIKSVEVPALRQGRTLFTYIVTKLERSGGLKQVLEDFVNARPEGQHLILSTELEGRSDIEYFKNNLGRQAHVIFETAPRKNYQQRLTWLQNHLQKNRPHKVYLFNHHQDSVAVAAIQPEMGLDADFYHHGDHHLCLGVYLSHLAHIDPHPMGYDNCRHVLGINNTYIPLVAEDKGVRSNDLPFLHNGVLTTCTAARSNKIEIPYFISYLEVIPRLLQVTGGRHVHIGRLTPWALFKIRRGLRFYGLESDRFLYTPWVPSVWKALHEYRVDLYIASFPYGGGLTLIEAMGAGIPVALHRHVFSRILSGIDLAYPEAFSWRYPEQLTDYCASLTADMLEAAGRSGRKQYEAFHRREFLHAGLSEDAGIFPKPSDPDGCFSIEYLEWALWMEKQINIQKLLYRAAYRLFRRLRAWRP